MIQTIRGKFSKTIAITLLLTFTTELLLPVTAYALTSGPTQPEMQSFEPVGTTDMVNMFTGDFTYNIPLLDIEGYPVNIAYHSGITMEQEASWVGLGWNINPGNINHIVRGIPDDFAGETIERELDIEPERNQRINLFTGVEFIGLETDKAADAVKKVVDEFTKSGGGGSGASIDFGLNINNYNGLSASIGQHNSIQIPWIGVGVNFGSTITTDNGTDVDYSLSYSSSITKAVGVGASISGSLNNRDGLQYTSYGVNASIARFNMNGTVAKNGGSSGFSVMNNTSVPIGLQNYVPVITNASSMRSIFAQIKVGGEVYMIYPYGGGSYAESNIEFEKNGNRSAYGYFNLDKATQEDIVDFTREKDGRINRRSKFLPLSNLTYDIYAINGQGTGGVFRPYRNDIGTVYDPLTGSDQTQTSHLGELGFGNVLEIGYDLKRAKTIAKSGPWQYRSFTGKQKNSLYEPFYFKQAGELTDRSESYYQTIQQKNLLPYQNVLTTLSSQQNNTPRVNRSNLLYFLNGDDASLQQISLQPKLQDYNTKYFTDNSSTPTAKNRVDANRKKTQASEFTQVLPDGRRYIYGLPVMNNYQYDFEVSSPYLTDINTDLVEIPTSNNKPQPYIGQSTKKYSSITKTPAYAHTYLLTSIISADYSDLTADGLSDDDLGTYTKFNYSLESVDYRWKTPYPINKAKYNRGLLSDCSDERATISGGSREQWILHSIETKNYIAEFHTSERLDAQGSNDPILGAIIPNQTKNSSYKLDSIALYNKQERIRQGATAVPLKVVVFNYDYSLCKNVPNHNSFGNGKLTLKSIFIRNGSSHIGYMSPYQFVYGVNKIYNSAEKDCWGNYKSIGSNSANGLNLNNQQFPYVKQDDPNLDEYSKAWNLSEIRLPSGGAISVTYESDDYGYVQNKKAMEMFKVEGVGPTKNYIANNTLYQDLRDPYLYVYFKRKTSENAATIAKAYLDDETIFQYNFEVEISPGDMSSCTGMPLRESVKGYAKVVESGICENNTAYAYLKLEPKTPSTLVSLEKFGIEGVKVSPITMAAINYARYYNRKALRPESDIPTGDGKALVNQLISSIGEHLQFFQNEVKTLLNKQKAKNFEIGKSYIRLVSQGLKKKGGGHRVKRLEFRDTWEGNSSVATYGNDYTYTTVEENTGTDISSGVASYEPLYGGDENPLRTLMNTNEVGNKSKFPAVDPIELMEESPIGESLYPSAEVGYSKVTVTSIHKDVGESSQAIQEYEHYTAKDFPVTYNFSMLEIINDRKAKITDLFHKREIYEVAQGYVIQTNDMHGKLKKQSTWVAGVDGNTLVSYNLYNYFENSDHTLNNTVPCLVFDPQVGTPPVMQNKTLGEEVDYTVDSRRKEQNTNIFNFSFSMNLFLVPPIPASIPMAFPGYKKQSSSFSSLVNTKVVQRYGILKSVESYDKGAVVKVENQAFDPKTGQVLISKVNSQHGDNEYTVKYPAYWAYANMGAAYENILYEEEEIPGGVVIDDKMYLNVNDLNKYNIGDELIFSGNISCNNTAGTTKKFKMWVVDKAKPPIIPTTFCGSYQPCPVGNGNPDLMYEMGGQCFTFEQLKQILINTTGIQAINSLPPFSYVSIDHKPHALIANLSDGQFLCKISRDFALTHGGQDSFFMAKISSNFANAYPGAAVPWNAPYENTLAINFQHSIQYNNDNSNVFSTKLSADIYTIYIRIPSLMNNSNAISSCNYSSITHSNVEHDGVTAWPCNAHIYSRAERKISTSCTNHDGDITNKALVLIPYKRNAEASSPITQTFPTDGYVSKSSLKVIRSGKRNQLSQTIQEITSLENPIVSNALTQTFNKTINSAARTYTDAAAMPQDININDPAKPYYNPFVIGKVGNYRIKEALGFHDKRNYLSSTAQLPSSQKGLYTITKPYWLFSQYLTIAGSSKLMTPLDQYFNLAFWKFWVPHTTVSTYSPWGADLEVIDAAGNRHSNIMGYNNALPVAVVQNAEMNDAMYENFEDYRMWQSLYSLSPSTPLKFYQNPVREIITGQFGVFDANNTNVPGSNMDVITAESHTGIYSLKVKNAPLNILITTNGNAASSSGILYPFVIRPGKKYIFSFWQKVTGPTIPIHGSMQIVKPNAIPYRATPKTPIIDGWVLYEGEMELLSSYSDGSVQLNFTQANMIIDDLRIMPAKANMKCYVYSPVNRRLMAVMDENHMSTLLEYSDDGKLVRIKKETERGILTIKESREGLRSTLEVGNPGGTGGGGTPTSTPGSAASSFYLGNN